MMHGTEPISGSGHKELVKPRMIIGEEPRPFMSTNCYALGWCVGNYYGETVINHSGSTNGFGCLMMYLPRLKLGVVIFGNSETTYTPNSKICWKSVDEFLGIPHEKQYDWDASSKADLEKEHLESTEELYPNLPDPIPLTLPLNAYAGQYTHNGYETLVVGYKDEKLQVDATDRTWRFVLSLEHVSGEFFIGGTFNIDTHNRESIRVQFRLGCDGMASVLRVEFVGINSEIIWFQR
jgi:hypothetical protein